MGWTREKLQILHAQIDKAIAEHPDFSNEEIASHVGCGVTTVYAHRAERTSPEQREAERQARLALRPRKGPYLKEAEILVGLRAGKTQLEIAQSCHVSRTSVSRIARKNGLGRGSK